MSYKYEKGLEILSKLHGPNSGEKLTNATAEVAPDFKRLVVESLGEYLERPHLDIKTREFIIVALCVSIGALPQLKSHIESSFEVGATKEEISEVILQTIQICGFPRAQNGLMVLKEVLNEKK